MATYGRGHYIVPSIRSVLQQDYRAFELIVVGDHCIDQTEAAVRKFTGSRVRWINLTSHCGSQSAPNNAGINAAMGDAIAYIGHDDLWEPDHLTNLAKLLEADPMLDFAVAGNIFHFPHGIPGSWVSGLFREDRAKHKHFFPPSSFAHRTTVSDRIGMWRMPYDIKAPVDSDFLLRAAKADMRFASTGKVSVQKFAAGHRYLSYLEQSSKEQSVMLAAMKHPDHAKHIALIVEKARQHGSFMTVGHHPKLENLALGELARRNALRKGNLQRAMNFPNHPVKIKMERGHFALDWLDVPDGEIRWTKCSPAPKHLIPYTGKSKCLFYFRAYHGSYDALERIKLSCNGRGASVEGSDFRKENGVWSARFSVEISLQPEAMTVVQFWLSRNQAPSRGHRGIGIGSTEIVPIPNVIRRLGLAGKHALAKLRGFR